MQARRTLQTSRLPRSSRTSTALLYMGGGRRAAGGGRVRAGGRAPRARADPDGRDQRGARALRGALCHMGLRPRRGVGRPASVDSSV